ncbi:MAG TPA: DUF1080 domain-containing protein [Gemmataceae bacterium]|nr:DUF1080 domain-containing protein [Gemmataceae bacterium]
MRNLSLVIFGLALFLPIPTMSGGEFKLESGFSLLFTGKNLDGWREKGSKTTLEGKTEAFKGRFKVANGVLVYDPKVGGDRYIETTKDFGKDVTFKFDFKAGPKCNNDILFRGTKFDIVPDKGETKEVKEGVWYTFELIATGNKVEHKINGKTVRGPRDTKAKSGPLVLRAEFGAIEIKNIRVKE